jgi:hypothetical protein
VVIPGTIDPKPEVCMPKAEAGFFAKYIIFSGASAVKTKVIG